MTREGGVDHIFRARYSKIGDIFRIDYSLQKADTLEIIATDHVTGKSEESFPSMVDEITKKIKANLELSENLLTSDIDNYAGSITTNSPEAFKYYSIGKKYLRQGENRKNIELMEQAVAIDPEFAMAYRSMAIAYRNLLYYEKAKELFQKALEFKDRLSDRERYRIEADFYSSQERTYDKAFEAFEKLLEIYPDEKGGRNNLAVLYSAVEEYQKALEHYEILINEYKTDSFFPYQNLAGCYRILGLYDKAREILEQYLDNFPDNAGIHRAFAMLYLVQSKYDLALEEMDKAFTLAPTNWINIRGKGHVYSGMGDWEKAEEEYRKLLEKEETVARSWGTLCLGLLFRLNGRFRDSIEMAREGVRQGEIAGEQGWIRNRMSMLAEMDLVLDKPDEALKKCDMVWKNAVEDEDLGRQRRVLHIKAIAYLGLKRTADAKNASEQLKELIEKGVNKKHIRRYYHLMGLIELEKSNYIRAIEFFKKGLPFVFPASDMDLIYADSLGLAYFRAGDLENAREEYKRLSSIPVYFSYNGDIYVKSFYMFGKINEELGDTAQAIENYEKFLELWKDADPGIAEVDDARQKLAKLMR